MNNMIIFKNKNTPKTGPVSDFEGGSLVTYDGMGKGNVYVVLMNKKEGVAAVNIKTGGYLTTETVVTEIPVGTELTVIVGGYIV